ncbi:MAG: cupin domain-containing protein [Fimbriimonadaceae bacterium]
MDLETTAASLSGKHLGGAASDFVVAEWRQAGAHPGAEPLLVAPLHVHNADDEAWYVLEGTLCVRRGDEVVTVHAGGGVMVPKGMVHTFWNPSPEPVRYLLIMTPRVFDLITHLHKPGRTIPASELFAAYDSQLC